MQTQQYGNSLTADCGIIPPSLICIQNRSFSISSFLQCYRSGSNWNNNENWLNGPVFTWSGVSVNDNRVRGLELQSNNLNGELPLEFFNLTGLHWFDMFDNNNLTGQILPAIENMTGLYHMRFDDCRLDGEIPAEIGATQLTGMFICCNNFREHYLMSCALFHWMG